MSIRSLFGGSSPSFESIELGPDRLFYLVKNERRRFVIDSLSRLDAGDGIDLGDLAEIVAARQLDIEPHAVSSNERKRVYVAMYQCHLPKLDEAGLAIYDDGRGVIRATGQTHAVAAMLSHLGEDFDVSLASGGASA